MTMNNILGGFVIFLLYLKKLRYRIFHLSHFVVETNATNKVSYKKKIGNINITHCSRVSYSNFAASNLQFREVQMVTTQNLKNESEE
jgi:hypothetical protein